MKNKITSTVLLFLLILFGSSNVALASEWTWQTMVVDTSTNVTRSIVQYSTGTSKLYVIYNDAVGIKLRTSTDKGQSWSSATTVIVAAFDAEIDFKLYTSSGIDYLFISHIDSTGNVKMTKSVNSGSTWSTVTVLTSTSGEATGIKHINANTIYVSHTSESGGNEIIYVSKTTDGGTNWTNNVVDNTMVAQITTNVSFDISGTTAFVAYSNATTSALVVAKSTDSGATWANTTTISNAIVSSSNLLKMASTSNVYISYTNLTGGYNLNIAYTDDTGANWYTQYIYGGGSKFGLGGWSTLAVIDTNTVFVVANALSAESNSFFSFKINFNLTDNVVNWVSWNKGDLVETTFANNPYLNLISSDLAFVSYGSTTVLKVAQYAAFSSSPQTVQNVQGVGALKSSGLWSRTKDASVGDYLSEGLIAVVPYEWDGNFYRRTTTGGVNQFYAVKRANITTSSVNINFGFTSKKVIIETSSGNSDEVCIDWIGNTAVCPAANTAGDDRIPAGRAVTFDDFSTSNISIIAGSGTQTVYVRAYK